MDGNTHYGSPRLDALRPPPPVARKPSGSSCSTSHVSEPFHFELDDIHQPLPPVDDELLLPPKPLYARARSSSPSGVSLRRRQAKGLPYINTPSSSTNVSTIFTAHSPRSCGTPPSALSTPASSIKEIKEPHAARMGHDLVQYQVPHSAPLHKYRSHEDYRSIVQLERGARSARSLSTSGYYHPPQRKLRNILGHPLSHQVQVNKSPVAAIGPQGIPSTEEILARLKSNHQLPRSNQTPEIGLDDPIMMLPRVRHPSRGRTFERGIRDTSRAHHYQPNAKDIPYRQYEHGGAMLSPSAVLSPQHASLDNRYYDHHCEEHGGPSEDCRDLMHRHRAAAQDLRYREYEDHNGGHRPPKQEQLPLQNMRYRQYQDRFDLGHIGHAR